MTPEVGQVDQVDAEHYRAFMGNWATGVALVTTNGNSGLFGATVNSLTSLSLHPPLLLVFLARQARILHAVRECGRFCVNLLSVDQQHLSGRFATKHSHAERFAGVPYDLVGGMPVLNGCLAYAVCDLEKEIHLGDRVIAVGRAIRCDIDANESPVVFFRREYRQTQPLRVPA